MLFDPARHEPLGAHPWDEACARDTIERIVRGAEEGFVAGHGWPVHPNDSDDPKPMHGLYLGDCGVVWALHYLQRRGAARLTRDWLPHLRTLRISEEHGSYLFGETPLLMMLKGGSARLEHLIEATMDHPARELMWGAPGTMLAALFMHRRTGQGPWAGLYRRTAAVLREQLLWSEELQCHYWTQDLYGERSTYLDAVHGFVATAAVLIAGRDLLAPQDWTAWEQCITQTIRATAQVEGALANWPIELLGARTGRKLMQFCHGSPGFVICLAGLPTEVLDDLLLAGGEATWQAGPLAKGSNLCHGTGGNGYAFLKLHRRTGDARWLERARAFAMHGIQQTLQDRERHGRWRHGLWTGDLGFAIYLLDCIETVDAFPTLDVFD